MLVESLLDCGNQTEDEQTNLRGTRIWGMVIFLTGSALVIVPLGFCSLVGDGSKMDYNGLLRSTQSILQFDLTLICLSSFKIED